MRCLRLLALLVIAGLTAALGARAFAQTDDEADKSRFVRYVEDTISTPDRKISIGRIDGVLSSDVRIASITVADRQGVWLTIEDAHLVWSRLALLSRRLDIDLLEAKSITIARKPLPAEGVSATASSAFSLPELPVSVKLTKLSVPVVSIDKSIAGEDTVMAVAGGGRFETGTLAAEFAVERTKPQGGRLFVKANYADATRRLDLDLKLEEPKNGFVSNLLDLPGRPALAFSIAGSGPIDAFVADVGLSADGQTLLGGKATLTRGEAGIDFSADVSGSLERLVPPAYSDFFAGSSSLSVRTRRLADGGLAVDKADIRSGVLSLALSGRLSADGFPQAVKASGRLAAGDGKPILLPGRGASVVSAGFEASLAEGGWTARFDVDSVVAGSVKAGRALIDASGDAKNLADATSRSLTFTVSGTADRLSSDDAAVGEALGERFDLAARGSWQAGQPVAIDEIRFANKNALARFVGRLDGNALVGDYTLSAPDLALFAGLAGSNLSGRADLSAKGSVALVGGAFSLDLDAKADGLGLGIRPLDALLAGRSTLTGGVARDPDGLAFRGVTLRGTALDARLDGRFGPRRVDLTAAADLSDVKVLAERAAGAAHVEAKLGGDPTAPTIEAAASAPALRLQGKTLKDAALRFVGTLPAAGPNGRLSGSGDLSGLPVRAAATIASAQDGTRTLTGLDLSAGAASLKGELRLASTGLAKGSVDLVAPDLAEIAPLLLVEASGRLSASATLDDGGGKQGAHVTAEASRLKLASVAVESSTIDVTASDVYGVPALSGSVAARGAAFGGFVMTTLEAKASSAPGGATAFDAKASLPQGRFATMGSIRPAESGFDVALDRLDLAEQGITAKLAAPIVVSSRPDGIAIPKAQLLIGQGGSVSVSGRVGETLELNVDIRALPASLANLAQRDLGAAGTINGRATIGGTSAAPTADLSVKGTGLTARAARAAGLPPLSLDATAQFARNVVTLDARLAGAGGIALSARGRLPLEGAGLDLAVTGSAPLAAANGLLAERGARLTGSVKLDARAQGSLAAPRFSGSAAIAGATFTDPTSGMQLTAIAGSARFEGDRLTLERLAGRTPGNGTIAVSGSAVLRGDVPLDLSIRLEHARVSDGRIVTAELGGALTLTGPALGTPTLAGRIAVDRAEITIPERFATNAALLGVKHLAPPPEVRATLARLKRAEATSGGGKAGGGGGIRLDITIDAPSRIFVRGRGLDAELGGRVTLTGPLSALAPVGSIKLRRGALNVIGRRIDLDRGEVRLLGDLDPEIDFSATTRSSTITVTARVTGRASDPQIVLSSQPDLPQDEILSQFLFGHSISDLSPFQVVQLATAVAQLAGGQGGGLLASIRKSTGLDTLNITTDSTGNAALQAGRYINERTYFGVTTGASGSANATVNFDVTRNLKARAEAGTQGGKLGVYYEREF